jgi:dihydrofolate synthase/folylpolyglutamate synthase
MVNSGLALATLEILAPHNFTVDDAVIRSALPQISWSGRLESFCLSGEDGNVVPCTGKNGLHFLLDGAHNPAGIAALCDALEHDFEYDRLILVWAAMADKDFRTSLPRIARLADIIIFTRLEYDRSASPEELRQALPPVVQQRALCENTPNGALAKAAALAGPADLICIGGSLYLVGEARKKLLGEIA